MKVTLSVIKADVGSIGGHTKPSSLMLEQVRNILKEKGVVRNQIIDFEVCHCGDDIVLIMSHKLGAGNKNIHDLAWGCFLAATKTAKTHGLYGAGQDLLKDAPSGNIRGAGPGVAEIEFDLLPPHRPAEAILVFAADKCGPGAYNFALWNTFCNPMKNGGLMLAPKLAKGFLFTIIDMNHTEGDRIIKIRTDEPHAHIKIGALLRNIDRFAVESVHSLAHPEEQIVSVAATRLHNIAGKYTGKDDPVMIVRSQGIFPAPEEIVAPFSVCPYVSGDCRGSHTMALLPVAMNTAVTGEYCQPIVACLALSLDGRGAFSKETVDVFEGVAWNRVREKGLLKSELMREQGFFGVAMASQEELAYTGIVELMNKLDERFEIRK